MGATPDRTSDYKADSLSLSGAVAMGTGVMIGAGIFALTNLLRAHFVENAWWGKSAPVCKPLDIFGVLNPSPSLPCFAWIGVRG